MALADARCHRPGPPGRCSSGARPGAGGGDHQGGSPAGGAHQAVRLPPTAGRLRRVLGWSRARGPTPIRGAMGRARHRRPRPVPVPRGVVAGPLGWARLPAGVRPPGDRGVPAVTRTLPDMAPKAVQSLVPRVRAGLRRLARRQPTVRRIMHVTAKELARALDDDIYGAGYFGAGRDPLDRMGLSGYERYDRDTSNANAAAYVVWKHFD